METRAETLRRLAALYRASLRDGVESELARLYLRAIAEAEAELAKIEVQSPQAPSSSPKA